ncbi:MAG TPA: O-antigen ligase family protein [Pseudolysinimonas sp.]|nr:O-antigen ligase family protein [Pseudolysinimonas sp.]
MSRRETYQRYLAVLGFFTLTAGDLWRNLLSWWGWGAICIVLLVLAIIELVHARIDLRRLPFALIGFLLLTVVSIFWSDYPGATAVGWAATFSVVFFAIFLATVLDLETMLRAFGVALRWILGLSLLFEFVVAAFIRHPVLPFFVDYSKLHKIPAAFYWSRDLLFHGGQLQGIQGNSNLFALSALFALIVFGVQWVAGTASKVWLAFWGIVAVASLALTRSSTVLLALAAVILVGIFVGLIRATSGARRGLVYGGGVVVALGIAAVGVFAHGAVLALLGKSAELTNRTVIWHTVLGLADQRPVAGWGWVGYWVPWVEPFKHLVVIKGVTYLQAHDAWIDIYFQLGVIGVILFGLLVLTTLVRSWFMAIEAEPRRTRLVELFPVLIMVALIVHSIAESRLLVEICLALLVIASIRTAQREPAPDE